MAKSVDPDQTAPIGAVCSGSMLFDSLLNSSVMLGNYLQQTTSADDIFGYIFFLCALWVKSFKLVCRYNSAQNNSYYIYNCKRSATLRSWYLQKTISILSLLATKICRLLITFANSLDPTRD